MLVVINVVEWGYPSIASRCLGDAPCRCETHSVYILSKRAARFGGYTSTSATGSVFRSYGHLDIIVSG